MIAGQKTLSFWCEKLGVSKNVFEQKQLEELVRSISISSSLQFFENENGDAAYPIYVWHYIFEFDSEPRYVSTSQILLD